LPYLRYVVLRLVLVILLGMVGLSAWVGYLDYILMPALLFFLALTVFAFMQKDEEKKSQ